MKDYQKELDTFKRQRQEIIDQENILKKEIVTELYDILSKSHTMKNTITPQSIIRFDEYIEENDGKYAHFTIFDSSNNWICNVIINIKNNKCRFEMR